jgi:RNA polymerase sigma-32 factor
MKKIRKEKVSKIKKIKDIEVLPKSADNLPFLEEESHLPFKSAIKSSSAKDLVLYDPLQAYLREMRQYPSLSAEQEHELAVRYYENADLKAAYKLVSSNLWLVVKIARDYERAAKSVLDLIQEGNIGLLEAVKNFDPYRGVRFPSYAAWWVKAYIVRYLIANWRLVKIGTTQAQRKLFFNLQKEKEKLEQAGFYAGPKLLAEKLNVKESEVIEMQQRLDSPDVSVDAPFSNEDDSTLMNILPADALSGEDLLVQKEYQRNIQESFEAFAETLKPKQKVIFEKRLRTEEKATLHELSEELGISKERVRQVENQVKEKLKTFLEEKYSGMFGQEGA